MTRNIKSQFEPGPDTELVEWSAQIGFDHLLSSADQDCDLAVGQTLPNISGDLNFLFR